MRRFLADWDCKTAAYKALVKILQRKEARFEQPGAYTPPHGEELFEELFLTLDGVVQNAGLRHYLDNPSGDGAERAKAYLAVDLHYHELLSGTRGQNELEAQR